MIKKQLLNLGYLIILAAIVVLNTQPAIGISCSNPSELNWYVTKKVNDNKNFYIEVSEKTNVPWQLLAAIHYREADFSQTNPKNGRGIFQYTASGAPVYNYGQVSDKEFVEQLTILANRLQNDYVFRGDVGYTKRKLQPTNEEDVRIKDVLFSYNNRASAYAKQAASYGYSAETQAYEGSSYVMNKFDCKRQAMGQITENHISLDGTDTRYGAFTVYKSLVDNN